MSMMTARERAKNEGNGLEGWSKVDDNGKDDV